MYMASKQRYRAFITQLLQVIGEPAPEKQRLRTCIEHNSSYPMAYLRQNIHSPQAYQQCHDHPAPNLPNPLDMPLYDALLDFDAVLPLLSPASQ